ncbi:TM2 domain-containing protein [Serinicoccus sp. LYQ131]|uniref:TM2 domain-containing protein n=1 Tax=Serinicoccus sp. LYQ131 TaxID=3378797 RepID=UPI003854410A
MTHDQRPTIPSPQDTAPQYQQDAAPAGYRPNTNDDMLRETRARNDADNDRKSMAVGYALWFFFGVLGVHRFYLGHKGVGVGMLLTLGGLGFWTLADGIFTYHGAVNRRNSQIMAAARRAHGIY